MYQFASMDVSIEEGYLYALFIIKIKGVKIYSFPFEYNEFKIMSNDLEKLLKSLEDGEGDQAYYYHNDKLRNGLLIGFERFIRDTQKRFYGFIKVTSYLYDKTDKLTIKNNTRLKLCPENYVVENLEIKYDLVDLKNTIQTYLENHPEIEDWDEAPPSPGRGQHRNRRHFVNF
jgi:hypothetical protein